MPKIALLVLALLMYGIPAFSLTQEAPTVPTKVLVAAGDDQAVAEGNNLWAQKVCQIVSKNLKVHGSLYDVSCAAENASAVLDSEVQKIKQQVDWSYFFDIRRING